MNFAFLLPIGLAALASLIVPIVLHLIRRPQHQVTEFAALRWVGERLRPRRRLRFDDPWLLVVRLLLLVSVALLLAEPAVNGLWRERAAWVVVLPGADVATAKALAESSDADLRWLAPGFPSIGTPPPESAVPTGSLLRELDATLAEETTLTVVVPTTVAGLDGERPRLRREVGWRVTTGVSPESVLPTARGRSPLRIALRAKPDDAARARFVRAATQAWIAAQPDRFVLDDQAATLPVDTQAAWLFWFDGPLPADVLRWVEHGGIAIVAAMPDAPDDRACVTCGVPAWNAADGSVLAREERVGAGRAVKLARPFDVTAFPQLLDADFAAALLGVIEGRGPAPMRGVAESARPGVGASASTPPSMPAETPLLLLAAGLFLLDRVLATRKRDVT